METWTFLLQKRNDTSWLPLDAPTAEILTGSYRLAAHSSLAGRAIALHILYRPPAYSTYAPLDQRLTKRVNSEGLLIVLPYTQFTPGLWEVTCRLADRPDRWSATLRLEVVAANGELAPLAAEAGKPTTAPLPDLTQDLSDSALAAALGVVHLEEQAAAEVAAAFTPPPVRALLSLDQAQFLVERRGTLTVTGVAAVPGEVELVLRDPQTLAVKIRYRQPIFPGEGPLPFALTIHLPPTGDSQVLVGTVTLYPAGPLTPIQAAARTEQAIALTLQPDRRNLGLHELSAKAVSPKPVEPKPSPKPIELPRFAPPEPEYAFEEPTPVVAPPPPIPEQPASDRFWGKLQQISQPDPEEELNELASLCQPEVLPTEILYTEAVPESPPPDPPTASPSPPVSAPAADWEADLEELIQQNQDLLAPLRELLAEETVPETRPTPPPPEPRTLPVPTLTVPATEVVAGLPLTITLHLPQSEPRPFVKLWVKDCQTRTVIDGPRWLADFKRRGPDLWEATTPITLPLGLMEVVFEAIAIDLETQQESRKTSVVKPVIPPTLEPLA
ncbi:MAG: hypothetical protein ACUVSQ_02920 [Pseudanabaenaceae cyanobacterium]